MNPFRSTTVRSTTIQITLLVAVLLAYLPSPLSAQLIGKKVTIYQGWPNSNVGYYRVKVNIAEEPQKASTRRQVYYLVATTSSDYQSPKSVASVPLIIEPGDVDATAELFLPLHLDQNWSRRIQVHIERDGNFHRDLGDVWTKDIFLNYPNVNDDLPNILIASNAVTQDSIDEWIVTRRKVLDLTGEAQFTIDEKKFPSINHLSEFYPASTNMWGAVQTVQTGGKKTISDTLASDAVVAMSPDQLPEKWIGLTAFQMIVIPDADVQALIQNDSKRYQSLNRWVAAGGTLVVADTGSQFENAERIRSLFPRRQSGTATSRSPWKSPNGDLLKIDRLVTESAFANRGYYPVEPLNEEAVVSPSSLSVTARNVGDALDADRDLADVAAEVPFIYYQHMMGTVIVTNSDMTNWTRAEWLQLLNAHQLQERDLAERIGGTSPHEFNRYFSIPGVGTPPIRAFQVLITLFVLGVGPLTFAVLKRRRRLQLLFVVVPLISLVTCLGLLAYAILSDGFAIRGRVQSFTHIDHPSEMAVSFIRHSHYAGVQPRRYEFGDDDFVVIGRSERSPKSLYVRSDSELRATGGDVRPRTPHQIVSVQNYQTQKGMVLATDGTPDAPRVKNNFENGIRFAMFRTSNGLFVIENLAAGESGSAIKTKPKDAASSAARIFDQLSPEVIEKYLGDTNDTYVSTTPGYAETENEFQSERIRRSRGADLVGSPGTYLALLEEFTSIRMPANDIDYKLKLHIVRGTW